MAIDTSLGNLGNTIRKEDKVNSLEVYSVEELEKELLRRDIGVEEDEVKMVGIEKHILCFSCPGCSGSLDSDMVDFDEDGFLEVTCFMCGTIFIVDLEETEC